MLSIADFAEDEATATVKYRAHRVEITFRPGIYTAELAGRAGGFAGIVAACVTRWNIDVPLEVGEIEKLPAGLVRAVWDTVVTLSTLAELPEVPPSSPIS